jgi:hypothetical protein
MALGAPSLPTSAVEPRQLRSLDRATKATGDRQRKRAPRKELQRSGRVTPYWESRSRGDALPLPLVRQIWAQIGLSVLVFLARISSTQGGLLPPARACAWGGARSRD